jgi:hypothetical protein
LLVYLLEPVTGVGDVVGLDAEKRAVFDDSVLEFLLLLARVGVIETQEEFSLVFLVCEVIIQQRSLGVTDMEVTSVMR